MHSGWYDPISSINLPEVRSTDNLSNGRRFVHGDFPPQWTGYCALRFGALTLVESKSMRAVSGSDAMASLREGMRWVGRVGEDSDWCASDAAEA